MIQVRIHLDKKSYLFKTLKKKNLLSNCSKETLFLWMEYKPNIGELFTLQEHFTRDEKLSEYLSHRKKILFRIIDLHQTYMPLKNKGEGITAMDLRVIEDSVDWL
jgi:hypothetical protein